MNRCAILVVDDDPLVLKVLTRHLAGHEVDTAQDFSSGRRRSLRGLRHPPQPQGERKSKASRPLGAAYFDAMALYLPQPLPRERIIMAEPFRRLIHNIKSKCASLRDAADLLPETSNWEKQELMESQARWLAQALSDERRRCQKDENEAIGS